MRVYHGCRESDGNVRVAVAMGGWREPLEHLVRHSPDGFDYGSLAPGSIDLARSILADCLGRVPEGAVAFAFAQDFILTLDEQVPWTIAGAEVEAWMVVIDALGCSGCP